MQTLQIRFQQYFHCLQPFPWRPPCLCSAVVCRAVCICRYPFTACEVFCCEVEAVFNTLLEDEDLLRLLFSLLDQEPPLSCKAAGYFGRVVGQLLLRKTNEMMQHLSHNDEILEKLIKHVDTTSIADIIKRLVGADDHSSMIFSPMHTQWLAETPLVNMLLDRLGPEYTPHVQVGRLYAGSTGLACPRSGSAVSF